MKKFLIVVFASVLILPTNLLAEINWNELSSKIKEAIATADLGRHSIETDYKSAGELRITGYVSSEADLKIVEDKLSILPGVKTVKNELIVRTDIARVPTAEEKKLNEKINSSVKSGLIGKQYDLTIENSLGVITLKGQAEDQNAIDKIISIAKTVAGVKSVTSLMQLIPPPSDPELVNRIKSAFKAEENLQADDIAIEAKEGIVTLSGSKRSHRVVDRILSIAEMVEGVKKIISNIGVEK